MFSFPEKLSVSPSPHIKTLDTVRSVMLDVLIALLPAAAWGVYHFGVHALLILLVSCATAVVSEVLYQVLMKQPVTAGDLSALVTGLILGLTMPSETSLWVPCVGSFFAVIVVKQLFGGIGHNIVNPALTARVFLMLCFPGEMTKFAQAGSDVISSATPLVSLKSGVVPGVSLFNCVLGNVAGCIGEVSVIAVFAGFIYLLCRKVVRWEIPVGFVGSVALYFLLFPITGDNPASLAYELCSGGILFCALIAANDWTTTPITSMGRLIFGIGCGIITVVIRCFGSYPEGCAFAVVIMNLLVPFLEGWTMPVPFGKKQRGGKTV